MNKNYVARVLITLVFMLGIVACSSKEKDGEVSADLVRNPITGSGKSMENNLPQIEFESKTHDFGIIVEGERVAWTYKFKNTGGSDLIITHASSTCGCTVPKYSKKPIPPGGEGKIEVVFNSSNRPGSNHKNVRVMSNTQPNVSILELTAEVYSPKKN